ncbi:MAG: hypothetical protein RLY57_19 [Candidatus Parcubacteria bacterium]|jgi:hypothetical protein
MHIDEAFALLRALSDRGSITENEAHNAGVILRHTTHSMIGWSFEENAIIFEVATGPGPYKAVRQYDLFTGTVTVIGYRRRRAVTRQATLAQLVAHYR